MWEIAARIHAMGDTYYGTQEMTRSSVGILHAIVLRPGISIAEITREHPTTQQAVSQVVARLDTLGLVDRRLVRGRTIGLYATAAGIKAQAAGEVIELGLDRELAKVLGHDKYERLRKALLDTREVLAAHAAESAEEARRPVEAAAPRKSGAGARGAAAAKTKRSTRTTRG